MKAGLGVDRWVVCSHASYHLGSAFSFIINQLKEIPGPYSEHYLGLIKCHSIKFYLIFVMDRAFYASVKFLIGDMGSAF